MGADNIIIGAIAAVIGACFPALLGWLGKSKDIIHLSEVEFRRALMARIEQLEAHDVAKSGRIMELEAENRTLRSKVAELELKLARQ